MTYCKVNVEQPAPAQIQLTNARPSRPLASGCLEVCPANLMSRRSVTFSDEGHVAAHLQSR